MAKAKYRCQKCKRNFSMAAHLARHNNAIHSSKRKKAARKKAARRKAARRGRPAKKRTRRRVGRPRGLTSRLTLRNMSLDQLSELIRAARQAARRRLSELKASIG